MSENIAPKWGNMLYFIKRMRSKFIPSSINHALCTSYWFGWENFDITKWMTMKTNRVLFGNTKRYQCTAMAKHNR